MQLYLLASWKSHKIQRFFQRFFKAPTLRPLGIEEHQLASGLGVRGVGFSVGRSPVGRFETTTWKKMAEKELYYVYMYIYI